MSKGIGKLKVALQRAIQDGQVTGAEAKKIAAVAKKGGVTRAERALVRGALNRGERDLFESVPSRKPLLAVAGNSKKRPLFGEPEAKRAIGRALADNQVTTAEAKALSRRLRSSSVTASAKDFIASALASEGARMTPAARSALTKGIGARDVDPATPPAEVLFDPEELAFMRELNAYRGSLGLPPVRPSLVLTRAADAHTADMAATNTLTHTGSDGSSLTDRVRRQTALARPLGEICAYNTTTGSDAFAAWRNSPHHDEIMRTRELIDIGISRVANAQGEMYWTADFGGAPIR